MEQEVKHMPCVVTSWKCPRCDRPFMLVKGARIFVIGCNHCDLITKVQDWDGSTDAIEAAVRELVEKSKGATDGGKPTQSPACLSDLPGVNYGSR